jgi:hypothetical protein
MVTMAFVYIAGPMTGYPAYNFDTFFEVEAAAEKFFGRPNIFNPARNDVVRHALEDLLTSEGPAACGQWLLDHPLRFSLRAALGEDLAWISEHATDMVLLPGWEKSKGALAEVALAKALGLLIWQACAGDQWTFDVLLPRDLPEEPLAFTPPDETLTQNWVPEPQIDPATGALHGTFASGIEFDTVTEIRTTSATGGQKGVKPERMSQLPKAGLDALARVFAFGAGKYEPHNWRKGYEWSKGRDAAVRHLLADIDGETYDPESGLPHLAHAGFHILTGLTWLAEQGEGADNPFDDRWPAVLEREQRESQEG